MLPYPNTPSLCLDRDIMTNNMRTLAHRLANMGVLFRPHVKTAKSHAVLQDMKRFPMQGITVSTLREAEYFFANGESDILYAVTISNNKFERAYELLEKGCKLTLLVDDMITVKQLNEFLSQKPPISNISLMIEIDVDGHRAGLTPSDETLVSLASAIVNSTSFVFAGLMTHAGESYACESVDGIIQHAELERREIAQAAARLRDEGISCPTVSAGSTPTALMARSLDGITEIRAGVFIFYDLMMRQLGVCDWQNIALSVLTTVIAHKTSHNRLILDAGGIALSKDRGIEHQGMPANYGLLMTEEGQLLNNLCVNQVNQEHGIVQLADASEFSSFPVGTRLRVLPNHACMTAAQYDHYRIIENGKLTNTQWQRCNGW